MRKQNEQKSRGYKHGKGTGFPVRGRAFRLPKHGFFLLVNRNA